MKTSFISLILVCIATAPISSQSTWPQFGGVNRSVSPENQRLPESFGPKENVLWRTKVGLGSSSPCVWGDRIFLTGHDDDELAVLCFDRGTGLQLWRTDFERGEQETFAHADSSPSAPTTCTDGERVIAYFGSYGLVALDMNGKELWKKTFPAAVSQFGHGSSPVLHDGSVYLVRDLDKALSFVFCFDAKTGKERWATPRPEAKANFTTPLVWKDELLVFGSSIIKSYALATGKPLWWVGGLTVLACPSPVATDDMIYVGGWSTGNVRPNERLATVFEANERLREEDLKSCKALFARLDQDRDGKLVLDEVPAGRAKDCFSFIDQNKNGAWEYRELKMLEVFPTARGKNILVAIKPGGKGDVTGSHVLWQKRRGIPYVATPLLYGGRLYYFKKGGFASCLDAKSGRPHYESKRIGVPGEYYASPVGVGDRIYVGTDSGKMVVLAAGDELKVLARIDFEESIVATPAVLDDTLYLRTRTHLYAIGNGAASN